jgi:hypothetical protein
MSHRAASRSRFDGSHQDDESRQPVLAEGSSRIKVTASSVQWLDVRAAEMTARAKSVRAYRKALSPYNFCKLILKSACTCRVEKLRNG